jgi:hypothetical protein
MIDTLTHMIDADTRYLLRLRDPTPPPADDRVGIALAQLAPSYRSIGAVGPRR